MEKLTRYATWANGEGRKVTNVLLGDGPAPETYTTHDGVVLSLVMVATLDVPIGERLRGAA